MKEQWFICSSEELSIGSCGTGCIWWSLKWWLVIVALPVMEIQRYAWHVAPLDVMSVCSALSALSLTEGWFFPFSFLLQAENIKGGMFMMDGQLFLKREATQGVGWEGSESGRLWCDETDRNILPSRVEMSGRGSLSGADGTITLRSQGGIHRGGEKLRDSGEDLALWSWLSCQPGSFSYNRTIVSWD